MQTSQLLLSLLLASQLHAEQPEGQVEKTLQQVEGAKDGGQRHHSHNHRRRSSHDHDHHHRRRSSHHHRHHSHDHHHEHHDSPPCDLSICTTKIGNFTMITRPVTWGQAPNACAMIGLRLAQVNIENFMDATKVAFQCSGPFSQSWVRSWNGDAYDGKGLVLSTGNAAPGGAINEVADNMAGRNVLCESSCDPIRKPECHDGCDAHEEHPGCGCRRGGHRCGCHHDRVLPINQEVQPILHKKMKCLRCFCRRSVDCPLQATVTTTPTNMPLRPTTNVPQPQNPVITTSQGQGPPSGRPSRTSRTPGPTNVAKIDEDVEGEKKGGKPGPGKALNLIGRFLQIPQEQAQQGEGQTALEKQGHLTKDGEDNEGDEGADDGQDEDNGSEDDGDDEAEQEDYEVEKIVFDEQHTGLEKGFPFQPETCGAQCVCYACKDYVPERHHHRRCHRRRHHHRRCHRHRTDSEPLPVKSNGDKLKRSAVQLKAVRLIAAFDADGNEIDQFHQADKKRLAEEDGQLKIQIEGY